MPLCVEAIPGTFYYWFCSCGQRNVLAANTILNQYGSCMDECSRCGRVVNVMKKHPDKDQELARIMDHYRHDDGECDDLGTSSEY